MQKTVSWIRRIRTASTTAAVLELVGSFLGSIPPSELERLPREIRAELGLVPSDLIAVAFDVVREDLRFSGTDDAAQVLHEVADTFAAASTRVAEIEKERA